jgi:hypothetical protein
MAKRYSSRIPRPCSLDDWEETSQPSTVGWGFLPLLAGCPFPVAMKTTLSMPIGKLVSCLHQPSSGLCRIPIQNREAGIVACPSSCCFFKKKKKSTNRGECDTSRPSKRGRFDSPPLFERRGGVKCNYCCPVEQALGFGSIAK